MAQNIRFNLATGNKALASTAKSPTVKTAKKTAPIVILTPGQKAAATKRANGLDLSAVAQKAVQTRRDNVIAATVFAEMSAKKARLSEIANRAVATRRANLALKTA